MTHTNNILQLKEVIEENGFYNVVVIDGNGSKTFLYEDGGYGKYFAASQKGFTYYGLICEHVHNEEKSIYILELKEKYKIKFT